MMIRDFQQFVQEVTQSDEVHPLADKMGKLNYLIYGKDDENGWHFDTTEFVLSIPLQMAGEGGDYQFVRGLRSAEHEDEEALLKRMKNPDMETDMESVNLAPGTLFFFKGLYTLHRVTRVCSDQERIVAIISYHRNPGHILSDSSKMAMYGRIA